jgi:hypothetical protein
MDTGVFRLFRMGGTLRLDLDYTGRHNSELLVLTGKAYQTDGRKVMLVYQVPADGNC